MTGANPPYVSFSMFEAFVAELAAKGIPDRFDPSVFGSFSEPVRAQLVPALRYLGLLNEENRGTKELRLLVEAHGGSRFPAALNGVLTRAYPSLASFDLSAATPSQFAEAFESLGCSRGVLRKVQNFYLNAARAAGRDIGQRLQFGRRSVALGALPSTRIRQRRARSGDAAEALALRRELLRKYPEFDPDWPGDVQLSWLEGMRSLVPSGL